MLGLSVTASRTIAGRYRGESFDAWRDDLGRDVPNAIEDGKMRGRLRGRRGRGYELLGTYQDDRHISHFPPYLTAAAGGARFLMRISVTR